MKNTSSKTILYSVVITACSTFLGHGQAIEQVDQLKRLNEASRISGVTDKEMQPAPALFDGEQSDTGDQYVLKLKKRATWFEATADSQLFYTSNMQLAEKPQREIGTSFFVNTAQIALTPPPLNLGPGKVMSRVGFRHQWFNNGLGDSQRDTTGSRLSDYDFDAQTLFAEARYVLPNNWIAEVGLDATRLLSHFPSYSSYKEMYRDLSPRWSVMRSFELGDNKMLSLGYQGNYRFTDTPNPFGLSAHVHDRTEHSLIAAYTHSFTPKLIAQPYYRYQISHYGDYYGQGRWDHLHTVGAGLYYLISQRFSARLFFAYDTRYTSSTLASDYGKFDVGGGLNFNFRF